MGKIKDKLLGFFKKFFSGEEVRQNYILDAESPVSNSINKYLFNRRIKDTRKTPAEEKAEKTKKEEKAIFETLTKMIIEGKFDNEFQQDTQNSDSWYMEKLKKAYAEAGYGEINTTLISDFDVQIVSIIGSDYQNYCKTSEVGENPPKDNIFTELFSKGYSNKQFSCIIFDLNRTIIEKIKSEFDSQKCLLENNDPSNVPSISENFGNEDLLNKSIRNSIVNMVQTLNDRTQ